jgi:hypothetical protein
MAYNSCLFNAAFYNCAMFGPNAQQVADEAARLAAEDELARDRMHYVARQRRERQRILAAATAAEPAPAATSEPAPLPPPNPELVASIVKQLTGVRGKPVTTGGWSPGIWLPPT